MTNCKNIPLVTIAIPTYNRADTYLRHSLSAAVNQTYPNIEIIVSDNCSTDHTEMLVKEFNDPRIRYIKHKNNIGANNNFNFCLEQARGEYVLLLQDDDLIDNDFIETCINASNGSTEIGILRTGFRTIDSEGNVLHEKQNMGAGLSTEDFILALLSRKVSMLLCSTLMNTKKLIEIGGLNSKYQRWQDVLAEIKLAAKYGRVDVPEIKASFRIHPSQMTFNVDIKSWCEDALILLHTMCRLCPKNKDLIRQKGMQYFARHSYDMASHIMPRAKRLTAYWIVFKRFQYRHIPPSLSRFLKSPSSSIIELISHTPLYYPLRSIKRKINDAGSNG